MQQAGRHRLIADSQFRAGPGRGETLDRIGNGACPFTVFINDLYTGLDHRRVRMLRQGGSQAPEEASACGGGRRAVRFRRPRRDSSLVFGILLATCLLLAVHAALAGALQSRGKWHRYSTLVLFEGGIRLAAVAAAGWLGLGLDGLEAACLTALLAWSVWSCSHRTRGPG